jgi:gliding motility-associated-like protein
LKSVVKKIILAIFIFLLNKNLQASSCIPSGTTVTLTRQSEVDSFPINYPGCDVVEGELIISGNDILNIDSLIGIKRMYYMQIYNTSLLNLDGLDNLERVYHTLNIESNQSLINLNALQRLDSLIALRINFNNSLQNLYGFSSLSVVRDLDIFYNNSLRNLQGLNSVKFINNFNLSDNPLINNLQGLDSVYLINSMYINNNRMLLDFTGLSSLTKLYTLSITNNENIINLNGFQRLGELDNFSVTRNSSLLNFEGFDNITNTNQHCYISDNPSLTSFQGLNNWRYMETGLLVISNNSSIINLYGLNNLEKTGGLLIQNNNKLKNLQGIEQLSNMSSSVSGNTIIIQSNPELCSINELNSNLNANRIQTFSIVNNPNLSCCKKIDEIFTNSNRVLDINISNNAPGCNDTTEIRTITTQNCCSTKYTFLKDTICQGETVIFDNKILTTTGTYYDTIIANGNDSIIILELKVYNKSYTIQTKNLCIGQSFTLSNGNVITTNGTYKDTIPNVCDSIIEYQLNFVNNITTSLNANVCKGKTYTLPKGKIVAIAGIYKDTLQSSFGCDSIITTNLTVTNPIPYTNTISICSGKTYTLPNGNIVKATGIYRDTIIKPNTCDSIVITNLTVNPYLQSTQTASICLGKSFTLPSGRNVNQSGIYKDTIKNLNGCDSIITTNLTIANPIANNINVSICNGQTHTLPNGRKVSTTGVYTDTIKKINTCDSIVVTNLNVFPNTFNISLNPIDTIEAGNSIELKPFYSNQIATSWNWTPTQNLSCTTCENPIVTPIQTTQYIVNAIAPNGCEDTAMTTIVVRQTNVYIPDAFSPNNDGVNDVLKVFVVNPKIFSLKIYNRYGELVFENNDVNSKWNGTYKGENCEVDTYSFILDVTQQNGKQTHQQGIVLLVR